MFYDLSAAGADVIRIRSVNGAAGESLSLRQSAGLLREVYNLLVAAARAAEKPRAAYRGRMNSDVAEYLDEVRLVPGYCEGYALTLHAPVPVSLEVRENFGGDLFPRRATDTLARALAHTQAVIADQPIAGDALELFAMAVQQGVNANLCDSVAALATG